MTTVPPVSSAAPVAGTAQISSPSRAPAEEGKDTLCSCCCAPFKAFYDWLELTVAWIKSWICCCSFNEKDLLYAVENNKIELARIIIPCLKENHFHWTNSIGQSFLHTAITKNHLEILTLLLESPYIDVNTVDSEGLTLLSWAIVKPAPFEAIDALLCSPRVDVNLTNSEGASPLHLAVFHKRADVVERLLSRQEIRVNAVNAYGVAALHLAAKGELPILQNLLRHPDIDVNISFPRGRQTPLHTAVKKGSVVNVRELLSHPQIEFIPDRRGRTPLTLARDANNAQLIEILEPYEEEPSEPEEF